MASCYGKCLYRSSGNFRVKIFRGLGATTKIYYHENLYTLRNYVEKMKDFKRDLCVRGFHVYRDIWEAAVGEVLDCESVFDAACTS